MAALRRARLRLAQSLPRRRALRLALAAAFGGTVFARWRAPADVPTDARADTRTDTRAETGTHGGPGERADGHTVLRDGWVLAADD